MENLIQQIRTKFSITQEELAHILGVSYTSVNAWEGGKRSPQEHMHTVLTDILNADSLPRVRDNINHARGLYRSDAGYVSSILDYDNNRDSFPYTHGIGRWYGSLPSFLVRDILQFVRTDFSNKGPILANFSGSGTIPLEAGLSGMESYAVDVNSMALLLSVLKTTPIVLSDNDFECAFQRIVSNKIIDELRLVNSASNLILSENRWLSDNVRTAFKEVCCGISAEKSFNIQLIFSVAFAAIAVDYANIDKRCTNHYVYKKSTDFKREDFEKRLKKEAYLYYSLNQTLHNAENYLVPKISYGDTCSLTMKEQSIGIVFSHPPYGNTINYYSINRMQMSIIELIDFKADMEIPSIMKCKQKDISSSTLQKFRSFTKSWVTEVERVLRPGGVFIAVIGDSRDNGKLSHPFTDIIIEGEKRGLVMRELFIWITNHKAGMHVKRKGNHIDHNYIIIMEKPI